MDADLIPYTPDDERKFFRQIDFLNADDAYSRCVRSLDAIPRERFSRRAAFALARVLENYAVIGDDDAGTPPGEAQKALERAIAVLETVREDSAEWNKRMAYAYEYLPGREERGIAYARRWAELEPENENAALVLRDCQNAAIRNGNFEVAPGAFWDESAYAAETYTDAPLTEELLASVERELGFRLPESYIRLMKRRNGGIPAANRFPARGGVFAIHGIFGIGREKACSLCGKTGSRYLIKEWGYPEIGVAICDTPGAGHDMVFLDYRGCGPLGEPAVVYVSAERGYEQTRLADSFEAFVRALVPEEVLETGDFEKRDCCEKE